MLYEALFKHVLFPAYETVVRRRGTASYVAEYNQGQWLSPDRLAALQLQKLNATLTELTDTQAKYIGVPKSGPYKSDRYRY